MSARRQRIKAAANLSQIKRKARKDDADIAADAPAEPLPVPMADPLAIPVAESLSVQKQEHADEDVNEIAFKMPAVSSLGLMDDVFHSDIEDNVIQMDLQKTANGFPMSPSKAQARQRVRPTPVFGQRRNSFVGSPLAADYDGDYQSPGTPTRRERYLSGSSMNAGGGGTPQQQMQASPKYLGSVMSPGMGRIRTESSCSVFSDSGGVGKQRKGDGEKSSQSLAQQRVNAKRDFETRFNNGVPDKSTFKMFDMIFYNPDSNPMEQKPLVTTIKAESANGSIHSDEMKPPKAELMETKADVGAGASPQSAMPVPQLKLDANGEMIIDEKTLEIETTAEVEARKVLANSSLILMDETTGDNGFYKRHKRTPAWSSDDTVRFYRSLQIIGTDFSLMCQMFPKRTRRELKLKYKREERMNGQLINKALLYPKAFNIQELKEQLEKEDQERLEAERQWQEIVATQPTNVRKRSKSQHSKGARTLSDGDLVYENEQVLNKKLGKHALAKRRAAMENGNTMPAAKRKRRPLKQKQEALQLDGELEQEFPSSYTDIKREGAIKTEQLIKDRGEQLQQELNSLLDDEETDDKNEKALHKNVIDMEYVNEASLPSDATDIDTLSQADTIFTIDFIGEPSPLSTSNSASVSEHDIEQILTELAEGSMVLVSSIDPNYEDRIVNEIYMYDKQTGDLCEQPLDIPEHIVQSILNVMS